MENYQQISAHNGSSEAISEQVRPAFLASTRPHHLIRSVGRVLMSNWHTSVLFAVPLILLTTLVVGAYYLNHPRPEVLKDTWSYLYVVDRIQTQGHLVNSWRLPGYPLFIVLVYALLGQGNLNAVSAAQAFLFLLATLEVYVLAVLVLRSTWGAFLIGLLVGTNLPLLSYVKPLMSEALGLWLLISLALAVVFFLVRLQVRTLWLVTLCTLLLFLTRPEWIYLPLPLFAYLLIVAIWRGVARRLLPHIVISVTLLYAILAGYVYVNATQNHFAGVTWIQNINMLGKVLQYNMQDEAPPQYAGISHTLDTYVAKGRREPWAILAQEPALSHNGAALAGAFAQAIIEHHPGEFLVKSVPVFFSSLTVFREQSSVVPAGPFGRGLIWLQFAFRALYLWNILFPLCAGIWFLLLCWRRTRHLRRVQMMGAVVLLSLYGIITTSLGAYREFDYMRLHTPFEPLLILLIWATLLAGTLLIIQHGPARFAKKGLLLVHHMMRDSPMDRTGGKEHASL